MTSSGSGIGIGKEAFLRSIAARLGRTEPLSAPPVRTVAGVPEFYAAVTGDRDSRIEQFARELQQLGGGVVIVPKSEGAAAVSAYARRLAEEHEVESAIRWDDEALASYGLDEALAEEGVEVVRWVEAGAELHAPVGSGLWADRSALLRKAEQCKLGIVAADYAVANTGTLVLAARGPHGRSVSLLTRVLLAVVDADCIVQRMGEAFELLRADAGADDGAAAGASSAVHPLDLPSSLNLITGPSRSADIENDLTIGIHGPGSVHAVILV